MALTLIRCKQFLRLSPSGKCFYRNLTESHSGRKGLVLGVYSDEKGENLQLTPTSEQFNGTTGGKLFQNLKLAGNKLAKGKSLLFWGLDKEFPAVAVVGLGERNKPPNEIELICQDKETVRSALAEGCKCLDNAGIKTIQVEDFNDAESTAESATLTSWKFQEYKQKKDTLPIVTQFCASTSTEEQWKRGEIKGSAQNIARGLADTPANLLTPTIFAERVQALLKDLDICVKIHGKEWAEKERMQSFLSVARGSIEAPKFLELTYKNSEASPIVLVGKGVTFDSGGISIKPAGNMDLMRGDMAGGACVVGTLFAIAKLQTRVHLKVLVPLVENMPSGSATKPGDVVIARNGKSICVDNTDAEGRLILADALCYSAEFKPSAVLDVATLTGAMAVALGAAATGVFSNSNALYRMLEDAGAYTGDRVWRMPLWDFYSKQVNKYPAYDVHNVGKTPGKGGSCTAAAFLKEFAPAKTDWMHLDIAGVMDKSDSAYLTGVMTGRPTRTLVEFIEAYAHKNA